jgi:hypothetical protein
MTAIGWSGPRGLALLPRDDKEEKAGQQNRTMGKSDRIVPGGIGDVEEGSLEEEIWRELGALPRSRNQKPGRRQSL